MKRVGVIGDTHGDMRAMRAMAAKMSAVDAFIHLGDYARDSEALREMTDVTVYAVRGNNDLASRLPDELTLTMGAVRVLVTHGHLQSVKRTLTPLAAHARAIDAQVALFGHTHVPQVIWVEGILLINPGACRSYGGKARAAVLEKRDGQIVPFIIKV